MLELLWDSGVSPYIGEARNLWPDRDNRAAAVEWARAGDQDGDGTAVELGTRTDKSRAARWTRRRRRARVLQQGKDARTWPWHALVGGHGKLPAGRRAHGESGRPCGAGRQQATRRRTLWREWDGSGTRRARTEDACCCQRAWPPRGGSSGVESFECRSHWCKDLIKWLNSVITSSR